ncbi:MAG: pseudouridine synthase [Muribaculaceae bacterium]
MEANEAKKPKRPRIQTMPGNDANGAEQHYEKPSYQNNPQSSADDDAPAQGGYNPDGQGRPFRPYNRQGGYQRQGGYNNNRQGGYQRPGGYNNRPGGYQRPGGYNRPYNNYNRQGGYQQRDDQYQQRAATEHTSPAAEGAENATPAAETPNTGYQPRQNNYGYNNNRQGGYQRQGGYNNNRPGGYQQRQGGYNNNRPGGYQRQGGYNNNRPGGYQRQGGYNNNRQGGYNNNRPGGYDNNRPGGYNNNNRRPGGYNNRNNNPMRQGKTFTPRPKRIEYELPIPDPNEQIRLNKFMANAGLCSRREADEFIQQGLVKVNGQVVTELGTKISHDDTVEFQDKAVALESKCYILLNKPKDCVTTSDDPNGRTTVLDLVKGACTERIYPVGRLDRNTTGVLLLTNDGDLASKLTHPKYVKKKIYHVWTDKDIAEEDMQRIADGIELEDGPIHADAISYATETDRNQAGIEIHSGRNRIVRRIFESLGYHVTKLDRVYFAGLTKKNLPRGRWRYLTQEEVNFLKMGSFE